LSATLMAAGVTGALLHHGHWWLGIASALAVGVGAACLISRRCPCVDAVELLHDLVEVEQPSRLAVTRLNSVVIRGPWPAIEARDPRS
jgi:hypothetical protein